LKGTNVNTITDNSGDFTIRVPDNQQNPGY
jgi:hypothetical protein